MIILMAVTFFGSISQVAQFCEIERNQDLLDGGDPYSLATERCEYIPTFQHIA